MGRDATGLATTRAPAVRLTITKKLALAVILIVIVCIGTMAWQTSRNLQRGFVAYLNQLQAGHLDKLGQKLEQRYQEKGDFEWLRYNRQEFRLLLEQVQPQLVQDAYPYRAPRPQRHMERPGPGAGPDGHPPRPGHELRRELGRELGQELGQEPSHELRQEPRRDRPQAPGRGPGQELREPPPPLPPPTPMSLAGRVSILDANGRPLIGPPNTPPGIERPLIVNGQRIGTLVLMPLKLVASDADDATALRFIRSQIHHLLWLAAGLIALAILLSVLLARHILRPVAGLGETTRKIAAGQFNARAPVPGHDELSELARHVNEMAEALEQDEQRKRRMLADVSHELRTPLSVIRGEIEALQDGIRPLTPQALTSLHAEVLHLNKLVDDLHQLNLADSGHLACQHQPFDLCALLKNTVERFQGRAAQAHLRLSWQLPAQPLMLVGDADRINQVLTNLLENSIRYTDPNGQIRVSLLSSTRRAQIIVEDSAPGVPPEMLARLFDRLYRVDQARSRVLGGSGLGLAICRALVNAHNGQIDAAQSTLGGVQITILLPLGQAA